MHGRVVLRTFLVWGGLGLASLGALAEPLIDGFIVRLKEPDATRRLSLSLNVQSASASDDTPRRLQALAFARGRDADARPRLGAVLRSVARTAGASTWASGLRVVQPVGRASHLVRAAQPMARADAEALALAISRQDDVESVELDTLQHRLDSPEPEAPAPIPTPSDPLFPRQSWMHAVDASHPGRPDVQNAWRRSTGSPVSASPYIAVAVVDTGMLPDHPDLAAKWLPGYDFISRAAQANDGDGRDADPSDAGDWVTEPEATGGGFSGCAVEGSSWHGTLVAGQIAASANNNLGIAGLAWEARIVPVRVGGKCGAQLSDIIDGLRWAAGLVVLDSRGQPLPANPNPARVINLSFGGNASCGRAFQDAIDELHAVGAVVVAAAGNTGGAVQQPANCKGVVGVGALNQIGFKAPYSSFGPELALSTVGGDAEGSDACSTAVRDDGILSTRNSSTTRPAAGQYTYATVDGTSFSAPVVTGTLSLMLAVNPALTADQLVDGLRLSARPHVQVPRLGICAAGNAGRCACTTATCGAGVLDAPGALAYAADPGNFVPATASAPVIDDARLAACTPGGSTSPGGLAAFTPAPPSGDNAATTDSGGGSVDASWLLLLAVAAAATRGTRRPGSRR